MKFHYKKVIPAVVSLEPALNAPVHIFTLEGSTFEICAGANGVSWSGAAGFFQPEDGEVHMPVDEFRELMNRLASAFDFAWKEQEQLRKETAARKMILGL
jgi:hypothetical protein